MFDVPLSLFLGTKGHSSRDITWQDVRYRIHSFQHEGQTIWGLTAAILIRVRNRVEAWGSLRCALALALETDVADVSAVGAGGQAGVRPGP